MRTIFLLLLAAVPAAYPAKKEQQKPAVIEVLEAKAHRDQTNLNIDGHFKNTGERPAVKVVIIVDVLDSDKQTLTTMKGESDPESIDPGAEGEFHARMPAPARAVFFRIGFEEGSGRELKTINEGPFVIE
jgi:hypothetical protein